MAKGKKRGKENGKSSVAKQWPATQNQDTNHLNDLDIYGRSIQSQHKASLAPKVDKRNTNKHGGGGSDRKALADINDGRFDNRRNLNGQRANDKQQRGCPPLPHDRHYLNKNRTVNKGHSDRDSKDSKHVKAPTKRNDYSRYVSQNPRQGNSNRLKKVVLIKSLSEKRLGEVWHKGTATDSRLKQRLRDWGISGASCRICHSGACPRRG